MFDLYLREIQRLVFEPVAKAIAFMFTPNQLTTFAFILGLTSGLMNYY